MGIPDYQTMMLPLLRFLSDQQEHSQQETIEALASQFGLTPEERREHLPGGQQAIMHNRVGRARTYIEKAGLIEFARRGHFCITKRGPGSSES